MTSFLGLQSNQLTGEIPSEFGLMTGVTYSFSLHSNNLCGAIPAEVATLSSSSVTGGWDITTDTFVGPTPCPAVSALVALYEGTGGSSSWTANANWMGDPAGPGDPCTSSWYGFECSAAATPTGVPTLEPYVIASTISGEAEAPATSDFLTLVEDMWGLNADDNCESPWFIWESIYNASDGDVYSEVRVCFDTDYDTWAAGHTGDDPSFATSAHWQVTIPSESVDLTDSGVMVRAIMYGDTHGAGEYGLHYKRTDSVSSFTLAFFWGIDMLPIMTHCYIAFLFVFPTSSGRTFSLVGFHGLYFPRIPWLSLQVLCNVQLLPCF